MPTPDMFEGISPEAQQAIRAFCGWHVAPSVEETLVLDGPGSGVLHLPSLHVTDVLEVLNDGTPIQDPEWSAAGLIRGPWTTKFRGVRVRLVHGYPADDLPYALQAAAARLQATAALAAAGQVRIGNISVTAPAPTTRNAADTTGDAYVDNILTEFRIGLRP